MHQNINPENLYTIKHGDRFWNLEKEWNIPFGTLTELNPGVDPYNLQIGQTVNIQMPNVAILIAHEIPEYSYGEMCYPDEYIAPDSSCNDLFNDSCSYENQPRIYTSPFDDDIYTNSRQKNEGLQSAVKGLSNLRKAASLTNAVAVGRLTSNELLHFQKNGRVTTPWSKMKNGQSLWNNNIAKMHRASHIASVKARAAAMGGTFLKFAGPILLATDVALSGEIKASHVVSLVLIGAATATGVGAIVAGVYFIADVGTWAVTGKGINGRLDGFVSDNLGRFKFYEENH